MTIALLDLNEPVVAALKTRLETDLPAVIAQVNAAVTDGFTITDPKQVLDFLPPQSHLTAFPTVAIGDGPTRFEDDIATSATGRHEIMMLAFLQDSDQRALAWKLRRYGRAIASTALQGRALGSAQGWGMGLVSIVPGPTLGDDPEHPRTFYSWTAVTIWVKGDED